MASTHPQSSASVRVGSTSDPVDLDITGFNKNRTKLPWGINKPIPRHLPEIVLVPFNYAPKDRRWWDEDFSDKKTRLAFAKAKGHIIIGQYGQKEVTLNPIGSFAELRLYTSIDEEGKHFFRDLKHYVEDTEFKYKCRVTGDRFFAPDHRSYSKFIAWESRDGPDATGTIEVVSTYAAAKYPGCVPAP